MSQRREATIRQWRIVEALNATRRGLTIAQITERIGASRATIYRDLNLLLDAGFPIAKETINAEARYRIDEHRAPPLVMSPLQIAALFFARERLEPLEGTSLVRELDGLLAQAKETGRPALALTLGDRASATPSASGAVERALRDGRRLRFIYEGVKASAATPRRVDPLSLHLSDNHLYLAAYDLDRAGVRTFKLVRMQEVEVLDEEADRHPEIDPSTLFASASKAWSGEVVEVCVKIPARLARFAEEWPLVAEQRVESVEDGSSVLVYAEVAGLIEPMRWVLRWGADAEAVAPPELRQMVAAELAQSIKHYADTPSD